MQGILSINSACGQLVSELKSCRWDVVSGAISPCEYPMWLGVLLSCRVSRPGAGAPCTSTIGGKVLDHRE